MRVKEGHSLYTGGVGQWAPELLHPDLSYAFGVHLAPEDTRQRQG